MRGIIVQIFDSYVCFTSFLATSLEAILFFFLRGHYLWLEREINIIGYNIRQLVNVITHLFAS